MTRALPALALLALIGCAHQQTSALAVTGATLDAAGVTFEAVSAGMLSASDAHQLERDQVLAWNDFLTRWKVGYPNACAAWRAAKGKNDASGMEQASAALVVLIGELNSWASVFTKARGP